MPAYALKPDASFYRKIVVGAIGARAVADDLRSHGHDPHELERGATGTKLWRDVKRKRVRIPDLVCIRCGQRVEVRTKTRPEVSMSHSQTDAERAWNFGMVPDDWLAFPICKSTSEEQWTAGELADITSYWHERNWTSWEVAGAVNYLTVGALEQTPPTRSATKGVTEGTETSIAWDALFSTREGIVTAVDVTGVTVQRSSDHHRYTWRLRASNLPCVRQGETVRDNQLLACAMPVLLPGDLRCSGHLPQDRILGLLASPERTLRFTGVKLVRLLNLANCADTLRSMSTNPHEDPYVRLEAAAGLVALDLVDASEAFARELSSHDEQTRLEAVIALADAGTGSSVRLLEAILLSPDGYPRFMQTAAAWSLGQIGTDDAQQVLVNTFARLDQQVREEALDGLIQLGDRAQGTLMQGMRNPSPEIIAGCAEALRHVAPSDSQVVRELVLSAESLGPDTPASHWAVWLLACLDRDRVGPAISHLATSRPELHYAVAVLWSFVSSWISTHWELAPRPHCG